MTQITLNGSNNRFKLNRTLNVIMRSKMDIFILVAKGVNEWFL